jgi:hypothetical protein
MGRRGQELVRGAVDPASFPGHTSRQLGGNSPAFVLSQHETLHRLGVLDRLQQPVQFSSNNDVFLSSPLTIRLFPPDLVHDVPGVNARRDEFRAFFGQLGEHLLSALVDKGHACRVHHALAFPTSGFCSRPAELSALKSRAERVGLQRPPLFGKCFGDRDLQHAHGSLPSLQWWCCFDHELVRRLNLVILPNPCPSQTQGGSRTLAHMDFPAAVFKVHIVHIRFHHLDAVHGSEPRCEVATQGLFEIKPFP